jgi:ketosteroid isomerase-like protein
MNPRSILAATAALSYFWIVLAGVGTVAEQSSDVENAKAASSALYASLSTVDIEVVENAWAREPYVRYIGPTNKAISAGWDEVKKTLEASNSALSARKVILSQAQIQTDGKLAWEVGIETVQRTLKNGEVQNTQNFVTNIYEKKNGQWLIVLHHAHPIHSRRHVRYRRSLTTSIVCSRPFMSRSPTSATRSSKSPDRVAL